MQRVFMVISMPMQACRNLDRNPEVVVTAVNNPCVRSHTHVWEKQATWCQVTISFVQRGCERVVWGHFVIV